MRLIPATVRMKLAVTAASALVLISLMTILTLQTTRAAHDVVEQARESHERMRVFGRVQYAATRFQQLTYQALRFNDEDSTAAVLVARRDFRKVLEQVRDLPQRNERDREVARLVGEQAEQVIELFGRAPEIAHEIDRQWHTYGYKAALTELQTLSAPYDSFFKTVGEQVWTEDQQIAAATLRASAYQSSVRTVAVLGLVLGLLLTAAMFFVLLTRLGPGLKRLERGALAYGGGDLGHRVEVSGHDELARLGWLFNAMAQQLADQRDALNDSKSGLERAVVARTLELEKANAALAAEDGRRRAFLADASHELRIPLTIIRGEAQVALRADQGSGVETAEVCERILVQTRALTRLLDDLFLIARAEAGGLRLNLQRIDVGRLARNVANDFSTLACESGATVTASCDESLFVSADPDRVRQVLGALIDNALRHTREGVVIQVEARAEAGSVALIVSDDGPGIDPATASELFSRFRRGAARGDGSGLGLTVVRALAEAHGGTASLANRGGGANGTSCGLRAIVRLPLENEALNREVA